jgi:hypothetical protein|tara:strand:- start:533 stop:1030 length:498 start_codon:yes stop_codon:yes gene_type:complete
MEVDVPSFDIVSKVDLSELKNAILNSMKEIGQRYDFKGSISQIELETDCVVVITEDDLKAKQVNEILLANLIRRKVDPKVIRELSREPASGNTIRIRFGIVQGIQKEEAKLINMEIKKSKLKVKSQVQGDELRVSGQKRDDLQRVIKLVKDLSLQIPAQFVNFRD